MQWARRSVLFSGRNMVLWGLGPPLGLLAWAGFLWAGYRLIRREHLHHAVLWLWVAGYFTWQSLAHNPTMRYQLPVYAPLAVFAAWAVVELGRRSPRVAVALGGTVLTLTAAWATAFTGIYTRPVTRVAASEWILRTLPGPINLEVEGASGRDRQILPVPPTAVITPDRPWTSPVQRLGRRHGGRGPPRPPAGGRRNGGAARDPHPGRRPRQGNAGPPRAARRS